MPLKMDLPPASLRDQLHVIQRVSTFHEFTLLATIVNELILQF
jgi:hypothetical protein